MRILITGGAGFIASHVAEACLLQGHDVAVLDDLSTGSAAHVPPGARFYQVDVRDGKLDGVRGRAAGGGEPSRCPGQRAPLG